jgi:hypothetical protein
MIVIVMDKFRLKKILVFVNTPEIYRTGKKIKRTTDIEGLKKWNAGATLNG